MNARSTRAVLFADITGSTHLYETLGDEQAHERIRRPLRRAERAAEVYGGRIVKHLGDGVMCAFADAGAAVRAAQAMQLAVARQGGGGSAVAIHVGCHCGSVLETAGDLFGDTVNVAARIAGLAKAGQILVTRDVADGLEEALRRNVRRLGHVSVKGRREPVELLEYLWQPERAEELTVIRTSVAARAPARLRLACAGRERWFDGAGAGAITLGRDAASDVAVADREASRRHARIERRSDAFVLVDHSANGTYVAIDGQPERCLRREEVTLRGRGRIALGRSTSDASATVLEFDCE